MDQRAQDEPLRDAATESRETAGLPTIDGWRRLVGAALVGAAFATLLLANLLHPEPRGPHDNGDFKRIFGAFSSGPGDLPLWPEDTTSDAFQRRFWYFQRYWRLDGGVAGVTLPSTSNLLFLPARVLRAGQPDGHFDLTRNGAYLTLALAVALAASLALLRDAAPFVALSLFALVASDANVGGYLSSFYQESGALAYLLLYVCALHVFWQRRTRAALLAAVTACVLLAATRFAYVPTVALLIAPVLAGIATARWSAARKQRLAALTAAAIAITIAGSLLLLADRTISRAAAYTFVFTTALPSLTPAERTAYVAALGLDPADVAESGKGAFEPGARFADPRLEARLGTPLLARAIVRLAVDHPAVALDLLRRAGGSVGAYPPLMYASDASRPPGTTRSTWEGWSALHRVFLQGWLLQAAALVLCVLLGWTLLRRPTDGWPLFFWVVATSFLAGSALQALVSTFGNGMVDVERHNFLATMLLDVTLITAGTGLWLQRRALAVVRTSRGA